MAFTPTQQLTSMSDVNLRDYQHAARIFVDDQFRLLPKQKFLYHVAFSINQAALKSIDLKERHKNEINMLVKSCDLPNFTIQTETLNQYNRKKNVQTSHKFNNINIKFHDDNMGLVNQLWQNYYSYYYADPNAAQGAGNYNRTATKSFNYINSPYGLDNGSTLPFFNYITIYQMARHEYVSYKLINPIITAWNHNNLDYSQQTAHDNSATIAYEAVAYGSGVVTAGDPEGFGQEHYDQTPSPLVGGGNSSATPSFANNQISSNSALSFLNNTTKTVNGYQNTQDLRTNPGTAGIVAAVAGASQLPQSVSGLQDIAFPVSSAVNAATTLAKTIKLF